MEFHCAHCFFTKKPYSDDIEVVHLTYINKEVLEVNCADVPQRFFISAQIPHVLHAFQLWENNQGEKIPDNNTTNNGVVYNFDFGDTFIGFINEEDGTKNVVLGDYVNFRFMVLPIECYKRMTTYTL